MKVENRNYLITSFLCFVVLWLRASDRIGNAHLWAEDGQYYLSRALIDSWSIIFAELDGYRHVFPGFITYLAVKFLPLIWIPKFFIIICTAVFALVSAKISRIEYRWIIPSDAARVIIAFLFPLMPGTYEIFGNLANVHTLLFFWMLLTALKDPQREFLTIFELCVASIAVFSDGGFVVLLPLISYRTYLESEVRKNSGLSPINPNAFVLLALIIASSLINFFSRNYSLAQSTLTLPDMWRGFLLGVLNFQLIFPWGGERIFGLLTQADFLELGLMVSTALGMAVCFRLYRLHGKKKFLLLALLELSVITQMVVVWIVRKNSISAFYDNYATFWAHRYSFLRSIIALLIWVIVIRPDLHLVSLRDRKFSKSFFVFLIFVMATIAVNANRWIIPNYGSFNDRDPLGSTVWAKTIQEIEKYERLKCDKLSIPIHPDIYKWTMDYKCGQIHLYP